MAKSLFTTNVEDKVKEQKDSGLKDIAIRRLVDVRVKKLQVEVSDIVEKALLAEEQFEAALKPEKNKPDHNYYDKDGVIQLGFKPETFKKKEKLEKLQQQLIEKIDAAATSDKYADFIELHKFLESKEMKGAFGGQQAK